MANTRKNASKVDAAHAKVMADKKANKRGAASQRGAGAAKAEQLPLESTSTPATQDNAPVSAAVETTSTPATNLNDDNIARNESEDKFLRVPLDDIIVKEGFNLRDFTAPENIAHVENLKGMIAYQGVLKPLTVHMEGKKYVLEDGESRLRAARLARDEGAPIDTVPVIVSTLKDLGEDERRFRQYIHNSGKGFSPLELSNLFTIQHKQYGWSEDRIAIEAGLSKTRVSQILDYASFPEPVKEMVKNDEMAATLAHQIMKENEDNPETVVQIAKQGKENAEKAGKKRVTAKHLPNAPARKPGTGKKNGKGKTQPETVKITLADVIRFMNTEACPKDYKEGESMEAFMPFREGDLVFAVKAEHADFMMEYLTLNRA